MRMFEGMDPWELIQTLQQRIETLERINNEIVKHMELTTNHLDSVGKAVNRLQKDQVDIFKNLHHLNTVGEHNDQTSNNT